MNTGTYGRIVDLVGGPELQYTQETATCGHKSSAEARAGGDSTYDRNVGLKQVLELENGLSMSTQHEHIT